MIHKPGSPARVQHGLHVHVHGFGTGTGVGLGAAGVCSLCRPQCRTGVPVRVCLTTTVQNSSLHLGNARFQPRENRIADQEMAMLSSAILGIAATAPT